MKFLGLDRWHGIPAKRPPKDEVLLYADRDGGLHTVDHSGEDKMVGGGKGVIVAHDFLFTEEATADSIALPIIAVDIEGSTFTVAGDHTSDFPALDAPVPIAVTGSTGNDGIYSITAVSLVNGDTQIVVASVSDDTADGTISTGRYSASLDLPAGATVLDVVWYELGGSWAADATAWAISDTLNGDAAYGDGSLNGASVYDPANPNAGNSYDTLGDFGKAYFGDAYSANSNYPGGGVRYDAPDTLTIVMRTAIATPPVVPVGRRLVRVLMTSPAPTDAVFA